MRKIKTRHTLKKACACISYYLALIPPCIYATISIIKRLQQNFPKMRGGQRPFGIFFKNSFDLVAGPFPKGWIVDTPQPSHPHLLYEVNCKFFWSIGSHMTHLTVIPVPQVFTSTSLRLQCNSHVFLRKAESFRKTLFFKLLSTPVRLLWRSL